MVEISDRYTDVMPVLLRRLIEMAEQEKEETMMDECVEKVGYFSESSGLVRLSLSCAFI